MTHPQELYDYLIIGSGFGSSVSAMRLTEKGYGVLVLERGKRFHDEDFPKTNWHLMKSVWMPKLGLYGIQVMSLLRHALVLHGTGVGGGSLVYANQLLVPPDKVFEKPQWVPGKWKEKLALFYAEAKRMLGSISCRSFSNPSLRLRPRTQPHPPVPPCRPRQLPPCHLQPPPIVTRLTLPCASPRRPRI